MASFPPVLSAEDLHPELEKTYAEACERIQAVADRAVLLSSGVRGVSAEQYQKAIGQVLFRPLKRDKFSWSALRIDTAKWLFAWYIEETLGIAESFCGELTRHFPIEDSEDFASAVVKLESACASQPALSPFLRQLLEAREWLHRGAEDGSVELSLNTLVHRKSDSLDAADGVQAGRMKLACEPGKIPLPSGTVLAALNFTLCGGMLALVAAGSRKLKEHPEVGDGSPPDQSSS